MVVVVMVVTVVAVVMITLAFPELLLSSTKATFILS